MAAQKLEHSTLYFHQATEKTSFSKTSWPCAMFSLQHSINMFLFVDLYTIIAGGQILRSRCRPIWRRIADKGLTSGRKEPSNGVWRADVSPRLACLFREVSSAPHTEAHRANISKSVRVIVIIFSRETNNSCSCYLHCSGKSPDPPFSRSVIQDEAACNPTTISSDILQYYIYSKWCKNRLRLDHTLHIFRVGRLANPPIQLRVLHLNCHIYPWLSS